MTETDLRELAERGAAELAGANADDLLAWTDANFGGNYVVASNMQDAVLVDLAAKVRPGVDVLFLDTGYHFVETIGTRDAVEAVYDIHIVNVTPENIGRQAGRTVRQGPVRPRTQRMLPDAQGRAAGQGAAWILGVGDRHPSGRGADAGQRPADQFGPGVRAGEDQSDGRMDR